MKLSFIGLGRMGSGMVQSLLRAGHDVTVYNRTAEKAAALASSGARVASSPAEACQGVEAAFTMLADDPALEDVVWRDDGLAAGLPEGAVHISSSTISTACARRLTAAHEERRQAFVSAPVFGRPEAAAEKKLVVVAAGRPDSVERCQPLFHAIGRAVFVAGADPWQANAVKLCGNFMIASMVETFSEAFATLRKAGVERHLFLDVINAVFGSPVYANYGRIIAEQRFEPAGFSLELGLKDVRLILETALECASPMPIASLVRDRLISALAHGQAGQDWSSIALVSERAAGL
jgi:3-hydroxyisobutyrate dehydrogenase-like beta-hydroxyacid dehydrogenase